MNPHPSYASRARIIAIAALLGGLVGLAGAPVVAQTEAEKALSEAVNIQPDASVAEQPETAAEPGTAAQRPPTAAEVREQEILAGGVPLVPLCSDVPFDRTAKDYRDTSRNGMAWRNVVEQYHFYGSVRRLELKPGKVAGELAYVLNRIPNHHHALHLVMTLEQREGMMRYGNKYSETPQFAYCFLQQARKFVQGSDPTVEMLLGIYFHKRGGLEQALRAYERAVELEPDFAEAHYNLGLLQFDREDFEGASASARRAAELGYPLSALRKKLARGGHWRS